MALRRVCLLILGVAGGMLAASVLYISAEEVLLDDTVPQQDSEPIAAEILLPAPVQGTTLVAQKLSAYDGPFLEDGSDREVVNVAALQVRNTGSREVLQAYVVLQCGNTAFVFYGECMPPGETVVLLERNAAEYQPHSITGCTGWQITALTETDIQKQIAITDQAMGTLVVTNLTDRTLENVRLYYKSWLSPPDVYVGGIAYMAEVPVLLPGETKYLYPNHYASGYSKVVSVTAD